MAQCLRFTQWDYEKNKSGIDSLIKKNNAQLVLLHINIDETIVRTSIKNVTDEQLYTLPSYKSVMFRNVKNEWCNALRPNTKMLQCFISILKKHELTKFVDAVLVESQPPPTPQQPTPPSLQPQLFVWLKDKDYQKLSTLNVVDILDELGKYCIGDRSVVSAIMYACLQQTYSCEQNFYDTLHDLLRSNKLIDSPPLRSDTCYRFVKLYQNELSKKKLSMQKTVR
ncbi:hypothetical protein [Epinotia aporema granulovirus]|uniref:Uncharacterized protein n=1 Tax=Epinotia aporema granulovirus TaxID=166056 RepID=K4EQE8_9BBAC|nr:hypothetical protein [Epinotia aporema granulovirus]AER41503.1 hypothetical protein [Epinotia aporema granulovirus]